MNASSSFLFRLALLVIAVVLPGSGASAGDQAENKYVKVTLALADSAIAAGGRGDILITLTPIEGIHINVDPEPFLSIDSGSVARTRGAVEVKKNSKGYLVADVPVRQSIEITPKSDPGAHEVRGTFTYYYCSDSEGWCMRYRQSVALTVIVKN